MGCAACKPVKSKTHPMNRHKFPQRRDVLSLYESGNKVKNITRIIHNTPRRTIVHVNSDGTVNQDTMIENNTIASMINPNINLIEANPIPNKKENIILYWEASRKTEKYHWWPLLNRNPDQEDPVNNLFAQGGGIYKYAKLCDNSALEYQKNHHSISHDSTRSDKNWAGFCDRASSLSCLYQYPCKPVTAKFGNRIMEFMPADIEALMICASENSVRKGKTVIFGQRNNMKKKDLTKIDSQRRRLVKSEPLPLDLLDILKVLTSELTPFVMDVDNGAAVWNYPFDKVIIKIESKDNYRDFLPSKGLTILYRFILQSSAYSQKNMDLIGYVNKFHNFVDQGWIGDKNPDFLWRQYKQEGPWIGKCDLNPYINAYHVYRIYLQSISKQNKIVKLTP